MQSSSSSSSSSAAAAAAARYVTPPTRTKRARDDDDDDAAAAAAALSPQEEAALLHDSFADVLDALKTPEGRAQYEKKRAEKVAREAAEKAARDDAARRQRERDYDRRTNPLFPDVFNKLMHITGHNRKLVAFFELPTADIVWGVFHYDTAREPFRFPMRALQDQDFAYLPGERLDDYVRAGIAVWGDDHVLRVNSQTKTMLWFATWYVSTDVTTEPWDERRAKHILQDMALITDPDVQNNYAPYLKLAIRMATVTFRKAKERERELRASAQIAKDVREGRGAQHIPDWRDPQTDEEHQPQPLTIRAGTDLLVNTLDARKGAFPSTVTKVKDGRVWVEEYSERMMDRATGMFGREKRDPVRVELTDNMLVAKRKRFLLPWKTLRTVATLVDSRVNDMSLEQAAQEAARNVRKAYDEFKNGASTAAAADNDTDSDDGSSIHTDDDDDTKRRKTKALFTQSWDREFAPPRPPKDEYFEDDDDD